MEWKTFIKVPYKYPGFPLKMDRSDRPTMADSCWYTDGSNTPEGAGVGVYSRRPRVEIADSLGQ
ncbi:hypothetical protein NQ315_016632 [Exocentrus adspersus]|uniref:Uncharacterized protein n=1 Tax=Exocentrus adspersus TaxID=1586481 RepID=A0AAV8VQ71_9CUCU|nr:hypothetical protein NQ315_016632 [Exocentrus adspersus]